MMTTRSKISAYIGDNLSKFLKAINCPVSDRIPCPVHCGGNTSACSVNGNQGLYANTWHCFSHNCHETFGRDLFGLVRGYLSRINCGWTSDGDDVESTKNTEQWIYKILQCNSNDINNIVIDKAVSTKKWYPFSYSKEYLRKWLKIPSSFYIKKGYSEDTLYKYCVGDCFEYGNFYKRAVVPIFGASEKSIAFTARSLLDKCELCNMFHVGPCPTNNFPAYVKWRHFNLESKNTLYNFYDNLNLLRKYKTVIIVESPGNTLRLEDAGIPFSVCTFGASIKAGQANLLLKNGIDKWIVLYDNDQAGIAGANRITNRYKNDINVILPSLNFADDIGSLSTDCARKVLQPIINKYFRG